MKKTISVLLCLVLLFLASACGRAESAGSVPNQTPSAAIAADPPAESAPAEAAEEAPYSDSLDAVDVDLTQLSSTMVYSEVYAMATEPEQYIGKTVKMQGLFATQEYAGERLYACIVQDATACCAQGLEFELAEESVFPDDYPEPDTEITVIGTFDSYKEEHDGNYYIYLVLRKAHFA